MKVARTQPSVCIFEQAYTYICSSLHIYMLKPIHIYAQAYMISRIKANCSQILSLRIIDHEKWHQCGNEFSWS